MLTDKELEERAEEYSHKVWCVDEICELEEEEINSLKDCEKDFKAGYKSAKEEIEKLNEQVKLLHDALVMKKFLCCRTDCHEIANNAIAKYEEMREKK